MWWILSVFLLYFGINYTLVNVNNDNDSWSHLQLNIEKPTKWFLNLASDKLSNDSPANKLRKYSDKYKNRAEWGKKYVKK